MEKAAIHRIEQAGDTATVRLKEWMEATGTKPAELAEALDVAEATVSRWRAGKRHPQSYLRKLEEFFHAPPGALFRLPEEMGSEKSLLAGLDDQDRDAVLALINRLRKSRSAIEHRRRRRKG